MAEGCLLYYITDRSAFPGDEAACRRRLLKKIGEAACAGVEYIQLREKDLSARELESLTRDAVGVVAALRTEKPELRTALLINSRIDVALAAGADGVHLRSDDVSTEDVKQIWSCGAGTHARGSSQRLPLIGASCHSLAEVIQAAATGASFAVFAPVFEKKDVPGAHSTGLSQLEQACQANIPVFALGGITLSNARSCLEAGAAGIAGIRLFQENDISEVVQQLRSVE